MMSTHNMVLWRTGENYPRIITKYTSLTIMMKKAPYLLLWSGCIMKRKVEGKGIGDEEENVGFNLVI